MTAYELIQRLAQYPPHTKVTIAHDWSEPIIDDSYQQIEGDPTITLKSSGWAREPRDGCECAPDVVTETLDPVPFNVVESNILSRLDEAVTEGQISAAATWAHVYSTVVR